MVDTGRRKVASHFDAIVIGTGQAGPSLAVRLAQAGQRVAVVERGRFGGTCVNTGCTPTKTLVASAYAVQLANHGAEFGFAVEGPVRADMKRVRARKDAITGTSSAGVESRLRGTPNCTVYQGHARFESPNQVRVGEELLEASQLFIDVGGRAAIPPLPGVATTPYLTNSTLLDVDFLPRHLVIVGGGYVGLEFGQMFKRFGSEVTIIEKASRLIAHEDEDVSTEVQAILEREALRCGSTRPASS